MRTFTVAPLPADTAIRLTDHGVRQSMPWGLREAVGRQLTRGQRLQDQVVIRRSPAPAVHFLREIVQRGGEVHGGRALLKGQADEHARRDANARGRLLFDQVGIWVGAVCRWRRARLDEIPQLALAPCQPRLQRLPRAGRYSHLQVVLVLIEEVRGREERVPQLRAGHDHFRPVAILNALLVSSVLLRPVACRLGEPTDDLDASLDLGRDPSPLRLAHVVRRVHRGIRRRDDGHEVRTVLGVHLWVPDDMLSCLRDGSGLSRPR
eukprot:scaffold48_cov311-Pinguiococcus_pyrenoidosus.AAC.330